MRQRILVVDDEQDLCDILRFNLTAAGYDVLTANSGEEALTLVGSISSTSQRQRIDLCLLDVMMDGMSGFDVARHLKSTTNIPIIFLTAKDAEDDKLQGFSLGADDYVAKPFSVREVLARVKAVLVRSTPSQRRLLSCETLTVDLAAKSVTIDGGEILLTKTEFDLLCLLMSHGGEVFSRQQLIEQICPPEVVVTNRTVDVNITRLRKKLARYASCIATRQGFGYFFSATPQAE